MAEPSETRISLKPARTGRHRTSQRTLRPDDLVRVEVRLPAATAARLYERADYTGKPVGATAAHLLDMALDATGGDDED